MGLDLEHINGQTPLDEDEKDGLLIPTITTKKELDEFEQQNIEEAIQWVIGRSLKVDFIFSEKFICALHKQMFGHVWAWAGDFRKTNKNLGLDKWEIPTALKVLNDDAQYWIRNKTYPPDEIAIRFKHRIVSIHCFSNGNGRHSRLMADIIIDKIFQQPVFSWGTHNASNHSTARATYLIGVKEADKNIIKPLLAFARS